MNFTGAALKNAILIIIGNAFIVFLAIRAFGAWARKEWGELFGVIAGAVLVAGIIYFPDQIVSLLQAIWKLLTGG